MAPRRLVPPALALLLVAGIATTGAPGSLVAADGTYECEVNAAADPIDGELLGRYVTGDAVNGETAAEIVAYENGILYVMSAGSFDIVAVSPTGELGIAETVDLPGDPTSIAVSQGLVAVSVPADDETDPGQVLFFRGTAQVGAVTVGSLPDMITFTPNGRELLVANEGEPNSYGQADSVDPEGSVSVIVTAPFRAPGRLRAAGPLVKAADATISFADFNVGGSRNGELLPGVRIFGPGAAVAQDLEPEYITVAADGRTAWVSLQENNAIARIDVPSRRVIDIQPLGSIDHSQPGFGLDPSDRDGGIHIANWPVRGLFMPDTIANVTIGGSQYVLTANEGDAREYVGFLGGDEEAAEDDQRARNLADPTVFPGLANGNLGRLAVTSFGDDGAFLAPGTATELFSFGTRSFSIRTAEGEVVWDSGDDFECITSTDPRVVFNASNSNNTFDDRSDAKGPEPEAVVVGRVGDATLAFVALERVGGVMVYDISDPTAPVFHTYLVSRNFAVAATATDSGPEGMVFVPADQSPTGQALLAVGHEVSGSVALWQIGG